MDLQKTPRNTSSLDSALQVTRMFYEKPVPQWAQVLDTADVPHDYYITFAATISAIMMLSIPHFISVPALKLLYSYGLATKPDILDFMENDFIPEFKKETRFKFLSLSERKEVFLKLAAVLIKMLWAFTWQEHVFPFMSFLYNPYGQYIGFSITPLINAFANKLSGFAQTDHATLSSQHTFPGDYFCNLDTPHSIWHMQSGDGFLELVFLTDYIHKLLA